MKKALIDTALRLVMLVVFTTSVSAQWTQTNWSAGNSFFKLYTGPGMVFARTWDSLNGGRIFFSANNGASWTQAGSADGGLDALSIVMANNIILAGTWNGFYSAPLDGTSWNAVTPAGIPADTAIWSIVKLTDASLFASATGHIYKSSDNGSTWSEVSAGLPANAYITSMVTAGNTIFAGTDSRGVFISTNGGTSWSASNSGLTDTHISQLITLGTKLFTVTLKGVFISDNNGTSWAAGSPGLGNINCLLALNNQLLAGTDNSGIYRSLDSGLTWTPAGPELPAGTRVWSLAADSSSIFAGTSSGIWRMPLNSTPGDVNGDGKSDIIDALLIAKYSAGVTLPVFIAANADVDCSGVIDVIDALVVVRYSAGLLSSFPCRQ